MMRAPSFAAAIFWLGVIGWSDSAYAGFVPVLPIANGGSALTIQQPALSATLITSDQTVTGSQYTKVALNSVLIDTASYWSSANNNYNPQTAGTYLACGSVKGAGTTVTEVDASVSKNGLPGTGTVLSDGFSYGVSTTTDGATSPCVLAAMNGSTDTLELDIYISGTGTLLVKAGVATIFSVVRVGP